MELFKVDLYSYFGLKRPDGAQGYLNVYLHHDTAEFDVKKIRPAMLVVAGGGYTMVSDREKEPIAMSYLSQSYNAFTLDYSVYPIKFPYQLIEGCMAVAYIKENAEKLCVAPDKVAAAGFSAGGHLCGMLATLYDDEEVKNVLGDKTALCRPDAVVLSYPVITSGEYAHRGSVDYLSGSDKAVLSKISLENRVSKKSSPAFIWCTVDDNAVPSENSLMMAAAYKKAGVPFELHMFESGPHGISTAKKETALYGDEKGLINPHVARWIDLSVEWLRNRGFEINIIKR